MTNNAGTFADLLRRAQAKEPTPAETWFYYFCQNCGEETRWRLTQETATQEIYACDGCHAARAWTVR